MNTLTCQIFGQLQVSEITSKYNETAPRILLNVAPSATGLGCQTQEGMCCSRVVVLVRPSVVALQLGCERITLQDEKSIMEYLKIREGVMQKCNGMSKHDACTFRTSSRILGKN